MTKKKFKAYLTVRESGITNMFDLPEVKQLARKLANTELTSEEIFDAMSNFAKYSRMYKIEIKQDA